MARQIRRRRRRRSFKLNPKAEAKMLRQQLDQVRALHSAQIVVANELRSRLADTEKLRDKMMDALGWCAKKGVQSNLGR